MITAVEFCSAITGRNTRHVHDVKGGQGGIFFPTGKEYHQFSSRINPLYQNAYALTPYYRCEPAQLAEIFGDLAVCIVWHPNCLFVWRNEGRVSGNTAGILLFPILAVAALTTGHSAPREGQSTQKQDPPTKGRKAKTDSLTGCIDEQEERYVLVDDRTLLAIATLEADGFPTEGFAKHVGHKVTVRGISSPGSALPHFKVRSIETVSDTCAPQQQRQGNHR